MCPPTICSVFAVLRNNPEFRKLWFSQVVSSAGDWFNRMAILALIGELGGPDIGTGLGALFAMEFMLRLLPSALFSPLAGALADRLPRRSVMIITDILRAAIVLGFLFVDEANELPLLGAPVAALAARLATLPADAAAANRAEQLRARRDLQWAAKDAREAKACCDKRAPELAARAEALRGELAALEAALAALEAGAGDDGPGTEDEDEAARPPPPPVGARWERFLTSVEAKGFFDGVEKGAPAYLLRYAAAVKKFQEQAAAFPGRRKKADLEPMHRGKVVLISM